MNDQLHRQHQKEIILAYAENDMDAKATGKKLYLSPSTMQYHLSRIKTDTGIDPRTFYGLCQLVQRMGGPVRVVQPEEI